MKVLEIKNNLVKIAYDVEDNLALSSFVIIEDTNSPYVGQVMNVKTDAINNFAIVKLLFTFNQEGILKNYNGTIPSLKANVSLLPANELLDIIPVEYPLALGNLAQQGIKLNVDKSILENNLLVCSNNLENTSVLIDNIEKQLDDKVIIWDCEGQFASDDKLVFGKDFKLPLNYETINFIYENELDDVDPTSRAIIQDIFIEVQEYIKTLPEGFLPFDTFLNVVDQQYKETQITQLVLLKNKLLKYRDLNVFAQELKDIMSLNIAIDAPDYTLIDISGISAPLQKEVMTYVYKVLEGINEKIYSFVKINNSNSDKKLLRTLLQKNNVFTIIICPHEYKYLLELKENAQNIIFFAPLTLQHDFASYNSFLNKLNSDEFIIYGAHTQNIPFIVELSEMDTDNPPEEQQEPSQNKNGEIEKPAQTIEKETVDFAHQIIENILGDVDVPVITEETSPKAGVQEEVVDYEPDLTSLSYDEAADNEQDSEPVLFSNEDELNDEHDLTILSDEQNLDEELAGLSNDEDAVEESNLTVLSDDDPKLNNEPDAVELLSEPSEVVFDEPADEQQNNEVLVEQAARDIDKVLYEKLPSDDEEISFEENDELTDELTEDDLNLIDDLSPDDSQEEIFTDENQPVVPIYEAENYETTQNFEPGERVSTAKYGEGVVEKMIKYGNKMLCAIDFPDIGRRLIDPAMTEITKLS